MTETATALKPLSPAEKRVLDSLVARAGTVTSAPAMRPGKKYQALVNLSVPRPDKQCDLVPAGETVTLTDEQAGLFMRRNPPVIRPASESGLVLPRIAPRQLFGSQLGRPGPPADARADPAGSTTIMQQEITDMAGRVPEGNEPLVGAEEDAQPVDAVDIPVAR